MWNPDVLPSVSVIIPAYNSEAFLREAVESALGQTHPPHEIIVVDDGSTDDTAAIARGLPVVYIRQENAGVSAARNVAIGHSKGELIALLDSDDVWLPEKLAIQIEALNANPDAGYAVCFFSYIFRPEPSPPSWWPPVWYREGYVPPTEAGYCIPSTWLIRRSTWDAVGPFDLQRRVGEDIDWLARAKDVDISTVLVEDVLLHKRAHETNLTSGVKVGGPGIWLHTLRASLARRRGASQA
jgi:glycosyltransferase involved in cell wall biosynthesis